ncbi:unnamed protein product [Phytophthora fragariaefolia]|uniref:Unnamed protein product n=1 Tax=Phytophthora fragariaefolia TaxID=1490495 RepID=A0A9W6XQ44_9STRA|nr:unnamed protein product [Phytophthora fragariaefolia]
MILTSVWLRWILIAVLIILIVETVVLYGGKAVVKTKTHFERQLQVADVGSRLFRSEHDRLTRVLKTFSDNSKSALASSPNSAVEKRVADIKTQQPPATLSTYSSDIPEETSAAEIALPIKKNSLSGKIPTKRDNWPLNSSPPSAATMQSLPPGSSEYGAQNEQWYPRAPGESSSLVSFSPAAHPDLSKNNKEKFSKLTPVTEMSHVEEISSNSRSDEQKHSSSGNESKPGGKESMPRKQNNATSSKDYSPQDNSSNANIYQHHYNESVPPNASTYPYNSISTDIEAKTGHGKSVTASKADKSNGKSKLAEATSSSTGSTVGEAKTGHGKSVTASEYWSRQIGDRE